MYFARDHVTWVGRTWCFWPGTCPAFAVPLWLSKQELTQKNFPESKNGLNFPKPFTKHVRACCLEHSELINAVTCWAMSLSSSVYLMLHDNSLVPRLPHSRVGKCTCGESLVTWSFVTYGTRYRKRSLSALNLDVKISSRFNDTVCRTLLQFVFLAWQRIAYVSHEHGFVVLLSTLFSMAFWGWFKAFMKLCTTQKE